jgi:hypothetical protein
MNRIKCLCVFLFLLPGFAALAEGQGRIKRKPPTPAEEDRIASETVMNDSLLQRGDIVVTDRGFFQYRGVAPDGIASDFVPVPNPLSGPAVRRSTF